MSYLVINNGSNGTHLSPRTQSTVFSCTFTPTHDSCIFHPQFKIPRPRVDAQKSDHLETPTAPTSLYGCSFAVSFCQRRSIGGSPRDDCGCPVIPCPGIPRPRPPRPQSRSAVPIALYGCSFAVSLRHRWSIGRPPREKCGCPPLRPQSRCTMRSWRSPARAEGSTAAFWKLGVWFVSVNIR